MLVKEQSRRFKTSKGVKKRPSHLKTRAAVTRYLNYLRQENHVNHAGKKIKPWGFDQGNQRRDRAEFEALAGYVESLPASAQLGRKRKWLARVYIASTAKGEERLKNTAGDVVPMMNEAEREYYAQRFIEEAGFGAVTYCWHVDQENGRCDCHFVALNCEPDEPERALKAWKSSIIQRRISSDTIEGEINEQRRKKGEPLLITMPQRQKEIKREEQIEDLAVQLARTASIQLNKRNLREFISAAGHTVTRQNDQTISVLHPGKKKARRYSVPKLLEEIEQSRKVFDRSGPAQETGLVR